MRRTRTAARTRLWRSSTFRLSLIYLAIFALSGLSLLAFVYFTTSTFVGQQIKATIQVEITGLSEQYRVRGLGGLLETVRERAARSEDRRAIYVLADPLFRPLAGNLSAWPQAKPDAAGWLRFPVHYEEEGQSRQDQALARTFRLFGDFHLLVGRSLHDVEQFEDAIADAVAYGFALTVLLGVVGGFVMSRQLLHRVETINQTVRRIMAGDLSQRMRVTGTQDEFDQLAAELNAMLDRIERLLEGIRTVSDNVAHDLRTPLHRLRSRIEAALLGDRDAAQYRQVLQATLTDADRLLATFNSLLLIAQAEAGSRVKAFEPVDLALLATDVVDLYEPLAQEKEVTLVLDAAPDTMVPGDRHLLSQALANLIDNAVKYVPAGGQIGVEVRPVPGGAEIVVVDNGPGVPEPDRERVLQRFVRLDETRSTPGNGLGLSLVDAVAKLHDARLELEDNQPGLRVRLRLPAYG